MVKKIKTHPENVVHLDNVDGAKAALAAVCLKSFFKKVSRLEKKGWEWHSGDLVGTWRFGRWEGATQSRPVDDFRTYLVVYMAGYNGQVMSDFEENLP